MEQDRTKWLELLARRPDRKCGRYAPSPTGDLHLGNLQTALLAYLHCRLNGGVFIMRMEDIDLPRNVAGSAGKILRDLRTLGISWDETYTQSERHEIYESALDFLKEKNLVFPCYCSRREIRAASERTPGATMLYPGTCRNLSKAEQEKKQENKVPSWRFRVSGTWSITDEILGNYEHDLNEAVGDFVLKRTDGLFSYQLAVVVDDILMGVSDVVRGADLLSSTPRQAALFDALQAPLPNFLHVPLLLDSTGEKMSKRVRSIGFSEDVKHDEVETLIRGFANNVGLPEPENTLEQWIRKLTTKIFIDCLRSQN